MSRLFKVWKLLDATHVSQDEIFRTTFTSPTPMKHVIKTPTCKPL